MKIIGELKIQDEVQGWNETVALAHLPDLHKARAYEIGKDAHNQILTKAPKIGDYYLTCSEKEAVAAAFVSQSSRPDINGDKYEPIDLVSAMFASKSVSQAVFEAYWLICRDGLSPDEWIAKYGQQDEDDPKD